MYGKEKLDVFGLRTIGFVGFEEAGQARRTADKQNAVFCHYANTATKSLFSSAPSIAFPCNNSWVPGILSRSALAVGMAPHSGLEKNLS
jgi:hypothetical protein